MKNGELKMKKLISILISAILLTAFSVYASAEGFQVSCRASAESVKAGSKVMLTVSVSNAGLAKSALAQVYAGEAFDVVGGQWVNDDAAISVFNGEDAVLAFEEETDLNGDLFKVVLKAKADTAAKQDVTVSVTLKNGTEEVAAGTVTQSLSIVDTAPGNTNSSSGAKTGGTASSSKNTKNTTKNATSSQQTAQTQATAGEAEESAGTVSDSQEAAATDDTVSLPDNRTLKTEVVGKDEDINVLWLVGIIGAATVIAGVGIATLKLRKE